MEEDGTADFAISGELHTTPLQSSLVLTGTPHPELALVGLQAALAGRRAMGLAMVLCKVGCCRPAATSVRKAEASAGGMTDVVRVSGGGDGLIIVRIRLLFS